MLNANLRHPIIVIDVTYPGHTAVNTRKENFVSFWNPHRSFMCECEGIILSYNPNGGLGTEYTKEGIVEDLEERW